MIRLRKSQNFLILETLNTNAPKLERKLGIGLKHRLKKYTQNCNLTTFKKVCENKQIINFCLPLKQNKHCNVLEMFIKVLVPFDMHK